jgi:hypothetical protein
MRLLPLAVLILLSGWAIRPLDAVVNNPKGYTLQFASALSGAVGDAATLFFGGVPVLGPQTTAQLARIYVPKAGVIQAVYLNVLNTSADGTAETSTVTLRVNNTDSSATVTNVVTNGATQFFSNTAASVTVVAGDYIELKWVTPTYATNPTDVMMNGVVYVAVP